MGLGVEYGKRREQSPAPYRPTGSSLESIGQPKPIITSVITSLIMKRFADRGFERLADVDERYFALVFFSTLLVYTLALVSQAVGYSADVRLFPLIVGVPLSVMLAVKILLLVLGDRLDLNVGKILDDVADVDAVAADRVTDKAVQYRHELSMTLWIGALTVLIYLFGNLTAVPIFIFAFVLVYERDVVRAAVVAGVTVVFIYLLFIQLLEAPLWRGVLSIGEMLS